MLTHEELYGMVHIVLCIFSVFLTLLEAPRILWRLIIHCNEEIRNWVHLSSLPSQIFWRTLGNHSPRFHVLLNRMLWHFFLFAVLLELENVELTLELPAYLWGVVALDQLLGCSLPSLLTPLLWECPLSSVSGPRINIAQGSFICFY